MRTRIFKALNDATEEKFLRIVNKIAVYDDDGNQIDCKTIFPSTYGGYYLPKNPNDEYGLFNGRIKDAVETIRNGYGDAICKGYDFPYDMFVYRYIDREIGENKRADTLQTYKNAKFAYVIRIFSPNSTFLKGGIIMHTGILCSLLICDIINKPPLIFNTEDEAKNYVNILKSRMKDMTNDYEKYHSYQHVVENYCFDGSNYSREDINNIILFNVWKNMYSTDNKIEAIQWITYM